MTLGVADKQGDLFDDVGRFCAEVLSERSIYSFLARERDRLFPDEAFADLFDEKKASSSSDASTASWCRAPRRRARSLLRCATSSDRHAPARP